MPSSGPGVQGQLQFPQPKPQFRLAHPQPSLELTSEKKGILGMHKALQELRFGKQEETHRGQEPEKEPEKQPEKEPEKSVNVIGAWFLVSTLNTV